MHNGTNTVVPGKLAGQPLIGCEVFRIWKRPTHSLDYMNEYKWLITPYYFLSFKIKIKPNKMTIKSLKVIKLW